MASPRSRSGSAPSTRRFLSLPAGLPTRFAIPSRRCRSTSICWPKTSRVPETPRDRRVQQRIDRLKREAQRLYDILENFLRFARLQELKLAPTDLNALVEEMCDFYEPQASTQGIVVRTHFAPDLPRLPMDADLFKQALSTSCSTPSTP